MTNHPGQSLPLVALILALLAPFIFGALDIFERQAQIAQIEDAMRNAARIGVQSFDYSVFAANSQRLASERANMRASAALRAHLQSQRAIESGQINAVMQRTIWHALPQGGTVRFGDQSTATFATPALCGETIAPIRGTSIMFPPIERRIIACSAIDRT